MEASSILYACFLFCCLSSVFRLGGSMSVPAGPLRGFQECGDAFVLVQERVNFKSYLSRSRAASRHVSLDTVNKAPTWTPAENPFNRCFIVTVDPEGYERARERLEAQGVHPEVRWGFNGHVQQDLTNALQLLKRYNHTDTLHPTVNNWMACMHMAPGSPPRVRDSLSEFGWSMVRRSPKNVEELLQHDMHGCVPKVVCIAATHLRLWEDIANDRLAPLQESLGNDKPWYLVMEEDAALCPNWRRRLMKELPLAPHDADVLKLFFFGHWRKEDGVHDSSPFLEAKDPMKGLDLFKSALYEVMKGAGWSNVPAAGFYAGTQAYLITKKGAQKLLNAIQKKPFQDIDMTMLSSAKVYVWRNVLIQRSASQPSPGNGTSLLQLVPQCNVEPPKDQFGW